jgi:hypothetical protein
MRVSASIICDCLPAQKMDAVAALGLQLLRFRDGKTRGIKANGVLMALGKELIKAAKAEGGYPDSDDSDSDDEDDDDTVKSNGDVESNATFPSTPAKKRNTKGILKIRSVLHTSQDSSDEDGNKSKPTTTNSVKRPLKRVSIARSHMDVFIKPSAKNSEQPSAFSVKRMKTKSLHWLGKRFVFNTQNMPNIGGNSNDDSKRTPSDSAVEPTISLVELGAIPTGLHNI